MKLIYSAVIFLQCIYAVAIGARQDGIVTASKSVERPIAVITPIGVPTASRQDAGRDVASFYALEDPDVILTDSVEDIDTGDGLKRTMGMLRMGRSSSYLNVHEPDEEKRTMGMLRMGKRAMGMLRMGRSDVFSTEDESDKRSMGMLRMGRSGTDEQDDKRAMGMLRMGRGMNEDEKRSMGMLRMGRSSHDEQLGDKRSMSMLRMGKRSTDLRL